MNYWNNWLLLNSCCNGRVICKIAIPAIRVRFPGDSKSFSLFESLKICHIFISNSYACGLQIFLTLFAPRGICRHKETPGTVKNAKDQLTRNSLSYETRPRSHWHVHCPSPVPNSVPRINCLLSNFYFCANWSVVPCQMVGLEGPMGSW